MAKKKLVAAEALDLIPDTTAGPRWRDVEKAIRPTGYGNRRMSANTNIGWRM